MIFQAIFAAFTTACILTCFWALFAIWRSKELSWKPLWAVGSLIGFSGLRIDWNAGDDLIVLIGIQVPVFTVTQLLDGTLLAKSQLPVVALFAMSKVRRLQVESLTRIFDENSDTSRPA